MFYNLYYVKYTSDKLFLYDDEEKVYEFSIDEFGNSKISFIKLAVDSNLVKKDHLILFDFFNSNLKLDYFNSPMNIINSIKNKDLRLYFFNVVTAEYLSSRYFKEDLVLKNPVKYMDLFYGFNFEYQINLHETFDIKILYNHFLDFLLKVKSLCEHKENS